MRRASCDDIYVTYNSFHHGEDLDARRMVSFLVVEIFGLHAACRTLIVVVVDYDVYALDVRVCTGVKNGSTACWWCSATEQTTAKRAAGPASARGE